MEIRTEKAPLCTGIRVVQVVIILQMIGALGSWYFGIFELLDRSSMRRHLYFHALMLLILTLHVLPLVLIWLRSRMFRPCFIVCKIVDSVMWVPLCFVAIHVTAPAGALLFMAAIPIYLMGGLLNLVLCVYVGVSKEVGCIFAPAKNHFGETI